MVSAVLDTSVLVPSLTRDVLLEVAKSGVYRPLWSNLILAELTDTIDSILTTKGIDAAERGAYLTRLTTAMTTAFPDALTTFPTELVTAMHSPDPDDRHVIAAAVAGRADVIVTNDKTGFPQPQLPIPLLAQTPDTFLTYSIDLHPTAVTQAITNIAARTGRHGPRRSVTDLINLLEQRRLSQFAAELRQRT